MPTLSDFDILPYALVAFVLVIAPGSDVLLVVSAALRGSTASGVLTAAGICLGAFFWACLAGLGLVAALQANTSLFSLLTLSGILYMYYLGIVDIKSGLTAYKLTKIDLVSQKTSPFSCVSRGILVNLLNPKVGIFYIALLPQFIRDGRLTFTNVLFLGGIHILMGIMWLTLCSVFVDMAKSIVRNPRITSHLMIVAGALLVVFASILLWTRLLSRDLV